VLFAFPEDVLDQPIPSAGATIADLELTRPPAPDTTTVRQIVELLAGAQRPAILAGGGVIRASATDALRQLGERLDVPVFAAWRRPTVFPNDHPNYLGMTGYGAASTVLPRLKAADALLVIGCRLSEIASFDYRIPARTTRWAHVDLEPRHAGAGLRAADIPLAADAADFLQQALGGLPTERRRRKAADGERLAALDADRTAYVAASTLDDGSEWRGPGVHPGRVVTTLQEVLPENAILTTDAGNFGLWLARGYRFGEGAAFLGPTSGAMGYGLPAAIAASLCAPDRPVIALCGDGGFAMTMNELETAVRVGAKPVVLVFDNRRYGTIAMHQRNEGRPAVATDLGPIDFAAVARACGAQGGRVTRDVEFEPALRDALTAARPAVLQLELDPRWISPDRFAT
jgi:acetolactate synthase-1/2/3 large subunit